VYHTNKESTQVFSVTLCRINERNNALFLLVHSLNIDSNARQLDSYGKCSIIQASCHKGNKIVYYRFLL
jgi:hypothetical protein